MSKTTAAYDDGDAAASVLAYTDTDGAKAPAGVCAFLSGTTAVPVNSTDRLPVTLGLTDAELRASAVPVSLTSTTVTGTVAVTQSGSWAVSVSGTPEVTVSGTVAVSGPLTDAQLRASAVPVSGTFWQATQPVSLASLPARTDRWLLGSQTTLISTGLNSLANNTNVAGSVYDNTAGQTGDGYTLCDVELVVQFGTAPTAGTGISVWFLQSSDGTNYEDGGASVTPARAPDVVIPVRAVTTAQRIIRHAMLPWGLLTPCLRNDGTGQAFAASGNLLRIRPVTRRR